VRINPPQLNRRLERIIAANHASAKQAVRLNNLNDNSK
jgi:hypothetical protein